MRACAAYVCAITGGPGLGLLLSLASAGCSSADSPSEPISSGVVQDDLSLPGICGGPASRTCSTDSVCVTITPGGCPGPRTWGLCLARPTSCRATSNPVCGCDDQTYDNLCDMAKAGVTAAHLGACAPKESCASIACKVGQICTVATDGTAGCIPDPCSSVTCKAGQDCILQPDGTGMCVQNPCSGVTCKSGARCVVESDAGVCIPDPCSGLTCKAGQECVLLPDGGASCH